MEPLLPSHPSFRGRIRFDARRVGERLQRFRRPLRLQPCWRADWKNLFIEQERGGAIAPSTVPKPYRDINFLMPEVRDKHLCGEAKLKLRLRFFQRRKPGQEAKI